jgi:phosphoenolpyruvate carboxykinase (ATP)
MLSLTQKLNQGAGRVHANLGAAELVELAVKRKEGWLADNGALVVRTGASTGRSPDDKYVVQSATTETEVSWGPVNHPVSQAVFDGILGRAVDHLRQGDVFVVDGFAGASPVQRVPLRVVTGRAWVALFARTLFLRPAPGEIPPGDPVFTVVHAGDLPAGGAAAGIRSDKFIGLDLDRGLVAILGTGYAGEVKKSIFSAMNYRLPRRGVLTMHCSASVGPREDTALFFGLSGTGKTTLSADPARALIGDDEHGWDDDGVFNIEGGCYAKCIKLSRETEPQIYAAIRSGSVLENVVVDPETLAPDYSSSAITENTRATYPVEFIPGCRIPGVGPHPRHIIFLTADAFGVLPPVARLTTEQAMYHYLSGYTAKVAGTETGVTTPTATFSPCFGGPFLPLPPTRYAALLREKLGRHDVKCWLVNTGWTGGPYGTGKRMSIGVSRAVIAAVLSGALDGVRCAPDAVFGILVPEACPGVPGALLTPRSTWPNPADYDAKARDLAALFRGNFQKYQSACPPEVVAAGPGG